MLCSGYGGSWREKTMSKLLSYETIVKAHEGDPDAINTVLSRYAGTHNAAKVTDCLAECLAV